MPPRNWFAVSGSSTLITIRISAGAAALAYALGEREKKWLAVAGAIGTLPDLTWPLAQVLDNGPALYSWSHALVVNVPVALGFWKLRRPVAWGALLHLAVDVFTHGSSTAHLLHPFARIRLPIGIPWWHGWGWGVWAILWILLCLWLRRLRRNPPAPAAS